MGDVSTFEFDPDSFDRVMSIEMFEHMKVRASSSFLFPKKGVLSRQGEQNYE